MSNKIFVTGLPRSGSTLLCQILANHPDVFCDGMTSPLFGMIENFRNFISKDHVYLSRLDQDFETNYQRTENLYKSFFSGWLDDHHNKRFVVDKNRGWLRNLKTLFMLEPDSKVLINIRDLTQIFGSIEKNHEKTMLLGFGDDLPQHSADSRANILFSESGVVGSCLKSLNIFLNEYPESIRSQCYFVDYKNLVSNPEYTVDNIFKFCGLQNYKIDFDNLIKTKQESDSHYSMKWSHKTTNKIKEINCHQINPAIESEIKERFKWYYDIFYK
jgi:sulfotransferase